MRQPDVSGWDIVAIFARTGMSSFGGWSTTALLLEKELVEKRHLLTTKRLKGSVTYAQILPGATQVSIVANAGYQLQGLRGACLATISYLLPALVLITLFAICYFAWANGKVIESAKYLDGLIAALSGIILANAYKIGSKHAINNWSWLLIGLAFVASLWLHVHALLIILIFGVGGLLISWKATRKASL